jgi:hypothetical protein
VGLGVLAVVLLALFPGSVFASAAAGSSSLPADQMSVVANPVPLPIARPLAPVNVQAQSPNRIVKARVQSTGSGRLATAAAASPLLYQGGSVRNSVSVYIDFWGTEWQAPSQASVISYIEGFFNDVGGSQWAGTMGQYCSGISLNSSSCPPGANFLLNPVGQLKGSVISTNPVPAAPTFANIAAEAAAAAADRGNPSGAIFMVYTPSGKSDSGFGTSFCAYHSWVTAGSSKVPFGYMPYQPDAGSACGANILAGPLDGFSIVGGHEYAEALTDPFPSSSPGYTGWIDPADNDEIGDKCAWNPVPQKVVMNGHTWPVQSLFSNRVLAQGQSPCVFSTAPLSSRGAAQSAPAPSSSRTQVTQSTTTTTPHARPLVEATPAIRDSPVAARSHPTETGSAQIEWPTWLLLLLRSVRFMRA